MSEQCNGREGPEAGTSRRRVAVVTGGASGIGLGVCWRFAGDGYAVAMLDLPGAALERESSDLRKSGARVLGFSADVSSREQMDAAYDLIRKELGPITILVANAGISAACDFLTMPLETWRRMIDVNLTGTFNTIQPALVDMVAAQWGRVVTVSCHAGQSGSLDRAHYSASKAGVIDLTKSLAKELGRCNITVNTIPPSLVDTPLAQEGVRTGQIPSVDALAARLPVARAGRPEEIAAACAFLCSDEASYITGQQINVNGGAYV